MSLKKVPNSMLVVPNVTVAFTKNNVNTATSYATAVVSDITWISAGTAAVDTNSQWNGTYYTIQETGYYVLTTKFALNSVVYTAGGQFDVLWTDDLNTILADNPEFTMGSGTGRISGGTSTGAMLFTAGQRIKPRFFQSAVTSLSFQNLEVSIIKV